MSERRLLLPSHRKVAARPLWFAWLPHGLFRVLTFDWTRPLGLAHFSGASKALI